MKKRLKIAEQILIVLSLALILPLVIASAIIINTNQIAVRKELISSATIIANSVANELISLQNFEKNNLFSYREAVAKMPNINVQKQFLDTIKQNDKNLENISVAKLPRNIILKQAFAISYLPETKEVVYSLVSPENVLVSKTVTLDYINSRILNNFNDGDRQIYILDSNKNLLLSKNYNEEYFRYILEDFPQGEMVDNPMVFTRHKNQPNILFYLEDYNWYIIVASPKSLTSYGIIEARQKIIMSICLAAITVFLLFGFYTYALYTNIRQFFKTIRAISEGNYTRKLRFIIQPFTSQEVIFIAEEFNKMLEKIDKSYSELHESNEKLKQMDNYKSNLIDTVSHEFRTPLTSIRGYASSMLRHDIQIDEESRKKSLKIIKAQAERLSRMVEDLLVIPDIESATLRMNYKEVNLKNAIDTSVISTSKADISVFNVDINDDIPPVYCDEDRLIQILINLFENAIKYSKENTEISVRASWDEKFAMISVHNEAEYIDKETLNNLFEKFTRLESDLTRTTRGTGLGLFIVKGLVETMGGQISLNAEDGFEVTFTLPLYKGQDDEIA